MNDTFHIYIVKWPTGILKVMIIAALMVQFQFHLHHMDYLIYQVSPIIWSAAQPQWGLEKTGLQ